MLIEFARRQFVSAHLVRKYVVVSQVTTEDEEISMQLRVNVQIQITLVPCTEYVRSLKDQLFPA